LKAQASKMKSTRALLMIGASLVVALVAVWLASRWVAEKGSQGTSKLVVAAADIEPGVRLTPEQLSVVPWPSAAVPSGGAQQAALLVGRVAKSPLARGEPVIESKLAPQGTKGGLSAVVAEGKRAMTVRVNDVIGVAGFALPGNYVDIIVNTEEQQAGQAASSDKRVSKIVLEHILVLAVAQEANRDETKPKVVNAVTLELTPEQAEALDLARSIGGLSLALRNQVDPRPTLTSGATKATLLLATALEVAAPAAKMAASAATARPPVRPAAQRRVLAALASAPAAASAPPSTDCVEVIRGLSRVTECF
jgi:pilus assembly protein CpaB